MNDPTTGADQLDPCTICGGGNYMLPVEREPNRRRFHQKRCPGDHARRVKEKANRVSSDYALHGCAELEEDEADE